MNRNSATRALTTMALIVQLFMHGCNRPTPPPTTPVADALVVSRPVTNAHPSRAPETTPGVQLTTEIGTSPLPTVPFSTEGHQPKLNPENWDAFVVIVDDDGEDMSGDIEFPQLRMTMDGSPINLSPVVSRNREILMNEESACEEAAFPNHGIIEGSAAHSDEPAAVAA
jgi:hypothetical protein